MEQVLKQYRIPLLTALGAIVLAIVVYLAWVSPEGSKLTNLHTQETQLQAQQTSLQLEVATLKREKAEQPATCAALTDDVNEVPSAPDVDSFLQQVTHLAVSSGDPNTPSISVTEATGTTKGVAGTTPVAISLTLSGDYAQMTSFLKGLYSFPRLFTVTSVNLTSGASPGGSAPAIVPAPATESGSYDLTLSGNVYYSTDQGDVCATSR